MITDVHEDELHGPPTCYCLGVIKKTQTLKSKVMEELWAQSRHAVVTLHAPFCLVST